MIVKHISNLWNKISKPKEQNNKMKKFNKDLETFTNSIENLWFNDLQGLKIQRPTSIRKLATRWGTMFDGPQRTDADEAEIITVLFQEIKAELMQELISKMYESNPQVIGVYDTSQELKDLYKKTQVSSVFSVISTNFEHAKNDGAIWAIINPTVLTIIKTNDVSHTDISWQSFVSSFPPSIFTYVGDYKGIKLYVDAYATDNKSIIIGRPNAFTFSSNQKIKLGEILVDPNTFEPALNFTTDYEFTCDSSKLSLIKIELNSLACFL